MEDLDFVENVHVRYSSNWRSSWERLCREFSFHQKTAQANIETVIQCDWEVDQVSERNLRYSRDLLAAAYVVKVNFAG